MRKVLITIGALTIWGNCLSQNLEQIHLKDGSVIEGYICEQVPGKSISVQATRATLTASGDSLISSTEKQVPVADLSSGWKKWVMEQPSELNSVALTTLKFPNAEYSDVLMLEQGSSLKFLVLDNRKYNVGWDAMEKTVKSQRPNGQYSGIEDVVKLKDGSAYQGQITEQYPGKTIKIFTDNGSIISVNSSQVASMESIASSDDLPLLEQTPLLDRILVKGTTKPVEGFITSRVMGKNLSITTLEGEDLTFPLKEISKYQKFSNPNYKVLTDRQLAKGEVVLNGGDENAWFAPLESQDGYFILGDATAIAKVGDEILVEANLENPHCAIYLINGGYRKDIKIGNSKRTESRDVFTYQDLVERTLPFERTISPLGNVNVKFKIESKGDYVLSIQGKKGFIVIHVD